MWVQCWGVWGCVGVYVCARGAGQMRRMAWASAQYTRITIGCVAARWTWRTNLRRKMRQISTSTDNSSCTQRRRGDPLGKTVLTTTSE